MSPLEVLAFQTTEAQNAFRVKPLWGLHYSVHTEETHLREAGTILTMQLEEKFSKVLTSYIHLTYPYSENHFPLYFLDKLAVSF